MLLCSWLDTITFKICEDFQRGYCASTTKKSMEQTTLHVYSHCCTEDVLPVNPWPCTAPKDAFCLPNKGSKNQGWPHRSCFGKHDSFHLGIYSPYTSELSTLKLQLSFGFYWYLRITNYFLNKFSFIMFVCVARDNSDFFCTMELKFVLRIVFLFWRNTSTLGSQTIRVTYSRIWL